MGYALQELGENQDHVEPVCGKHGMSSVVGSQTNIVKVWHVSQSPHLFVTKLWRLQRIVFHPVHFDKTMRCAGVVHCTLLGWCVLDVFWGRLCSLLNFHLTDSRLFFHTPKQRRLGPRKLGSGVDLGRALKDLRSHKTHTS